MSLTGRCGRPGGGVRFCGEYGNFLAVRGKSPREASMPMIDEGLSPAGSAELKLRYLLPLLAIALALPAIAVAQVNPRGAPTGPPVARKVVLQTPATPMPAHPAVVRIIVAEKDGQSLGSGTLIDVKEPYALVVTNWHVIRDAAG